MLGVFLISDADYGSIPAMAGRPSSDATFTLIVAAADRFPLKYQNMFPILAAGCGGPESQVGQNFLVG